MRFKGIHALVLVVGVAAVAAVATLPTDGLRIRPWTALLLAAVTALAALRPVRIPALGAEFTAGHPLILFALAACDPMTAVVVAFGEVVGATIGRGSRPRIRLVVFNMTTLIVSTAAASWTFHALGGAPGNSVGSRITPLVAATAAYFVVNTGLVSSAIVVDTGRSSLSKWKAPFLWTALSYFAGLVLAVAMLVALESSLWWALALSLPPCWLLVAFYRTRAESLGTRRVA